MGKNGVKIQDITNHEKFSSRDSSSQGKKEQSQDQVEKRARRRLSLGRLRWCPKPSTESNSEEELSSDSQELETDKIMAKLQGHLSTRTLAFTLELEKIRRALPSCEAFINEYLEKNQKVDVRAPNSIKGDQVLAIQVECKSRKH